MARTIEQKVKDSHARAQKEIARLEGLGFRIPGYVRDNIENVPSSPTEEQARRYINRANLSVIRDLAWTEYKVETPNYRAINHRTGRETDIKLPAQVFRVPYREREKAAERIFAQVRRDVKREAAKVKEKKATREATGADVFKRYAKMAGIATVSTRKPPSAEKLAKAIDLKVVSGKKYGGELTSDFFLRLYGSPTPRTTLNREAQRVIEADVSSRAKRTLEKNYRLTPSQADIVYQHLQLHPNFNILVRKIREKGLLPSDELIVYYAEEVAPIYKIPGNNFILEVLRGIDNGTITDEPTFKAFVAAIK